MTIHYNVNGDRRKKLVTALATFLNVPMTYEGAPGFGYSAGAYHVDRDGMVTGPYNRELLETLAEQGFSGEVDGVEEVTVETTGLKTPDGIDVHDYHTYRAELSDPECPDRMEIFTAQDDADALLQAREYCEGKVTLLELHELDDDYDFIRSVDLDRLTITVPSTGFTPEKLDNLQNMVRAKENLIKAALGADSLPIQVCGDKISFPWFNGNLDEDHITAYLNFVDLLCKTAREKQRITAKAREIDGSPKYRMRCFLLSLGFVGKRYQVSRRILLERLSGSSAYSKPNNVENDND